MQPNFNNMNKKQGFNPNQTSTFRQLHQGLSLQNGFLSFSGNEMANVAARSF